MLKQILLLSFIFCLVLASTATGIFYQTDDPNVEATSLRGEHVVYQGSGLYRLNPAFFAREGVVWDFVNLFIGLPLFAVAAFAAIRGSLRGRLFLGGLLAYFWYVYLSSVMMYAFNSFFLVYVAIFGLCTWAFVQNLRNVDVSALPLHFAPRFPRRIFIGFFLLLALALVVLWLGRIVSVMRTGRFPEEYAGILTLGSQALDLGLLVPLAISAAVLLTKRSAWGYLLSSVCMTFGLMMFIAIPSWITVPLIQDGKTNVLEAIPFFVLSVAGIGLSLAFYMNVRKEGSR